MLFFTVASHLPYLFHIVTLLVHTGPVSLRASIHGLVINVIHSLCTCTKPSFGGKYFSVLLCYSVLFIHISPHIIKYVIHLSFIDHQFYSLNQCLQLNIHNEFHKMKISVLLFFIFNESSFLLEIDFFK